MLNGFNLNHLFLGLGNRLAMSFFRFLLLLVSLTYLILALVLTSMASAASQSWGDVLEAAKKEQGVVVYATGGQVVRRALMTNQVPEYSGRIVRCGEWGRHNFSNYRRKKS
jgi:hypothetical protein